MSARDFSTHSRIGAQRQVRDPGSPKRGGNTLRSVFMGPGMRCAHPGMGERYLRFSHRWPR